MPQTRYVIECSDGTSYDLPDQAPAAEHGTPKKSRFDLPTLLTAGWVPAREAGMSGGDDIAFAPVALEKWPKADGSSRRPRPDISGRVAGAAAP